jgi:hypothetical protein
MMFSVMVGGQDAIVSVSAQIGRDKRRDALDGSVNNKGSKKRFLDVSYTIVTFHDVRQPICESVGF